MVLLFAIFCMLHVDVVTVAAFQKSDERDRIIEDFNNEDEKAMISLMTYFMLWVRLDRICGTDVGECM